MRSDVHTFTHGAVHTGTYCTLTAFNMLKKKQVDDMKINHISGIKFITALEIIQNITVLPFTLNLAIVLESARSHESLFVEHLIQRIAAFYI